MSADEDLTTAASGFLGSLAGGDGVATAPAELTVGTVLAGRFRLVRRLGAGSTGVVFEVTDTETGAPLALKALRAPRPHRAHLLKGEFRVVRDLVHPRLVTVHELFVEGAQVFMTMDRIRGVTLTEAAREAARAGRWARVRRLFGQAATGVAALHEYGHLHRDLKPSNVLVDADDQVTILDFGLASGNPVLAGAGTPAYMAPEQIAGEPLTEAADWFALGLMLYEILTDGAAVDVPRVPGADAVGVDAVEPLDALRGAGPADLVALCGAQLAIDPASRPSAAEVLARLRVEPLAAGLAALGPMSARLVGRSEELATLEGVLRAGDRKGRAVLVEGAAGTGKSRLVRELLARARQGGALVLQATCSEYEHVAFNAFDGIADGIARELTLRPLAGGVATEEVHRLARLFPALGVAPRDHARAPGELPREERQAAFRAFARLLGTLGERRPVVLWMDDVQWADADSAELLRSLLSLREAGSPPLIACARRGPHASPVVKAIQASSWALRRIELDPLSPASALELAALALGRPPADPVAQRIAAESQGHPLFIEQLAAVPGSDPAAMTLERAVRRRVARLPDRERTLLELVSAHGGPVPRELAQALAADVGGRAILKSLCVRRLCQWADGAITTYHARIREVVYAQLTMERRRARHGTLYERLAADGSANQALLGEHARAAGLDEAAYRHLSAAASEAREALAFHQASTLLRSALALPSSVLSRDRALRLRERLAEVLVAAGRGAEAAAAYLELASHESTHAAHGHRLRAAEQLLLSGCSAPGFRLLDEVFGAHSLRVPRTTPGVLASLLAGRLRLHLGRWRPGPGRASPEDLRRVDALGVGATGYMTTDTLRGAWFATRQLIAAERTGDSARIVRALVFEALYLSNEGTTNEGPVAARLADARGHAPRAGDVESHALLQLAEGLSGLLLGRWAEGAAGLARAERALTHQDCQRWFELGLCRKCRSIAFWFTGQAAELERSIEAWLEDARERGDTAAVRSFSAERPLVGLLRDRPDEAAAHIAELEAERPDGAFDEWRVVSLHNRMHHGLYVGAAPEALVALERAIQPLWRSLLGRGQLLRVTSRLYAGQVLLSASLARGGDAGCLRRVSRYARRLRGEGPAYARLYAGMLTGAVEAQRGDPRAARRRLEAVARGFRDDGQRLYAAGARWRLGELTGGRAGAALVDEARRTMSALGVRRPDRFVAVLAPDYPAGG